MDRDDGVERTQQEIEKLRAERDALLLQLSELERQQDETRKATEMSLNDLRGQLAHWKDCHGATADKLEESNRLNDELRKHLSELVHEVEDTWHHHGRCMIGTDEQKPETECECGPDLSEHLEVLGRIRPTSERRKCSSNFHQFGAGICPDCGVSA